MGVRFLGRGVRFRSGIGSCRLLVHSGGINVSTDENCNEFNASLAIARRIKHLLVARKIGCKYCDSVLGARVVDLNVNLIRQYFTVKGNV